MVVRLFAGFVPAHRGGKVDLIGLLPGMNKLPRLVVKEDTQHDVFRHRQMSLKARSQNKIRSD